MKLIDAVMRNFDDRTAAEKYLSCELPGEDHDREVEEVFSDESCVVYETIGVAGVYFINHTGGWSATDNVRECYPEIYEELKARGIEE